MIPIKNYFRLIAEDQQPGFFPHLLKPVLSGASFFYGGGVAVIRELYQKGILPKKRLPFPVISVGNLTWGGTGKTPLVEYLARRVLELRRTPLVLTRGYGQDEVEQLKAHLPNVRIGVGKERYQVAQGYGRRERIDVAILDDGFQHWKVTRDIEIVTVNALNPFGNRSLFPRGILREAPQALKRATVVVLTHVNLLAPKELTQLRDEIKKFSPSSFITEAFLEPLFFYRARKRNRLSISSLENRRVATFSAVGSPRSFQILLTRYGIKPVRNFEYCDHHTFSRTELQEIQEVSRNSDVDEIVTTEKDFYRAPKDITEVLDPLVLATRIQVSTGEEILTDRIFRLLGVS
ncbi:MAG: tetraacyldisaccharide 4'-kinase [Candidatus Omnitrophica bacterium]|nr:tetraacyldisaccharide 4'-kinase [Candidatus Omnitrophota bacterium]